MLLTDKPPPITRPSFHMKTEKQTPWTSCQIRKIASCTCVGNAGNVFPATDFKGNHKFAIAACIKARASRTCVMHVGIANLLLLRKRSQHSRRMRNPFCVSRKRPVYPHCDLQHSHFLNSCSLHVFYFSVYPGNFIKIRQYLFAITNTPPHQTTTHPPSRKSIKLVLE